jgi:hypothetical protein
LVVCFDVTLLVYEKSNKIHWQIELKMVKTAKPGAAPIKILINCELFIRTKNLIAICLLDCYNETGKV